MGDPTGEADKGVLRLDFDRRVMLQFHGATITSDAGLLAYRELDDTLGLTDTGAERLADARTGKNGRHRLVGLLRQSVFGRLAGYEDVNDADRLCRDPAMRWVVGDRGSPGLLLRPAKWAASRRTGSADPRTFPPRRSRRPVDRQSAPAATAEGRRAGHGFKREPNLRRAGRQRLQRAFRLHLLPPAVRVQSVRRCGTVLCGGNVHSADGWRAVLEPVVARYRDTGSGSISVATRPSPIRRSMSFSKPSASAMRSGCRPTACCRTDRYC